MKKVLFASLFLLAAIGFFGYEFIKVRSSVLSEEERRAAQEAAFLASREQLTAMLRSNSSISSANILQGFWYTYRDANGNESVAFFYLDDLARLGLTPEQIAELRAKIERASIAPRDAMRSIPEEELPEELQFHNFLYTFHGDASFLDARSVLEKKIADKAFTSDDLSRLSYIYELEGKYAERDQLHALNCSKFKQQCGLGDIPVVITGRVVDGDGEPVPGAIVSLASRSEVSDVHTDAKGAYRFSLKVHEMEKIRVKAVKKNYSEGVASVIALSTGKHEYDVEDIALASALTVVRVDTVKKTVTGHGSTLRADGTLVIQARNGVYEIPKDAVVRVDGRPYQGVIEMYVYDFDRDTVPRGLVQADVFDGARGYTGDAMLTFGMPYIQFFTVDGEELHVLESKPVVVTYQMQYLSGEAGSVINKEGLEKMVAASIAGGFPITREFLIVNKLTDFPAWWIFDREAGVWRNAGFALLDVYGHARAPFYTLGRR